MMQGIDQTEPPFKKSKTWKGIEQVLPNIWEEEETDIEDSPSQVNMLCACEEGGSQSGDSECDPDDFMIPYDHGSEDIYQHDGG